jgi:hypothetical protein
MNAREPPGSATRCSGIASTSSASANGTPKEENTARTDPDQQLIVYTAERATPSH